MQDTAGQPRAPVSVGSLRTWWARVRESISVDMHVEASVDVLRMAAAAGVVDVAEILQWADRQDWAGKLAGPELQAFALRLLVLTSIVLGEGGGTATACEDGGDHEVCPVTWGPGETGTDAAALRLATFLLRAHECLFVVAGVDGDVVVVQETRKLWRSLGPWVAEAALGAWVDLCWVAVRHMSDGSLEAAGVMGQLLASFGQVAVVAVTVGREEGGAPGSTTFARLMPLPHWVVSVFGSDDIATPKFRGVLWCLAQLPDAVLHVVLGSLCLDVVLRPDMDPRTTRRTRAGGVLLMRVAHTMDPATWQKVWDVVRRDVDWRRDPQHALACFQRDLCASRTCAE
jgi:hypothetical protein